MSSSVISSIDSYEIAVPINDDIYIRQLDDYRMSVDSESCSGSGSDGEYKKITYPEAVQRLEKYLDSNELNVVRDYIQCKKLVFEHVAYQEQFKYQALNIHSIIATIVVAFLPWFQNTRIAISVIGGFILIIQQWIYNSKCGILAQEYTSYSQAYSLLLVHLATNKHVSHPTALKSIEAKLECLNQPVPANYMNKLPTLSSINIFAVFKHMEHNRNIQIRKYIHVENQLSKAKANGETGDAYVSKITKIKENLSKLNYNKLKLQLNRETSTALQLR